MTKKQARDAIKMYAMIVREDGNPGIKSFKGIGLTEAMATEYVVRIAGRPGYNAATFKKKALDLGKAFVRMRPYDNDEEYAEIKDDCEFLMAIEN